MQSARSAVNRFPLAHHSAPHFTTSLCCPWCCQTAQLPVDSKHISEMIRLIDANRDGCIGWDEFEGFMSEEISKGKNLLSGEYVLPSGERQGWAALGPGGAVARGIRPACVQGGRAPI